LGSCSPKGCDRHWRQPAQRIALAALVVLALNTGAEAGGRLQEVVDRGYVVCGVSRSGIGLSEISEGGEWSGLFVDFCRVLGAAIFADKDAVEYVEVNDVNRFKAIEEEAIDVLMANTTWTVVRDSVRGMDFTATVYYDGQGFLAHRSLGADNLSSVDKARVCVNRNTTTILNLKDLIATSKPNLEIIPFAATEQTFNAFLTERCDMLTYDRVVLRTLQLYRAANPEAYILFPDVISKEPLGPAVKQGDAQWFDVVQWSVFATIAAEEHGLRSDNLEQRTKGPLPEEVRRLLGLSGDIGKGLGLPADWAWQIIAQVGNYGEIFSRHLGGGKPVVDRGLNSLWKDGGLLYAPPFR